MKRGEVYLCRLGQRDETGEERVIPVVVLSRDAINKYGPVVVVAPVVESGPAPHPYPSDVVVRAPEGGLTEDGLVLTMQLRAVPRERLHHLLGTLSANAMGEIDRAVRITLDLEES
jgi:mRNA interferase MazF